MPGKLECTFRLGGTGYQCSVHVYELVKIRDPELSSRGYRHGFSAYTLLPIRVLRGIARVLRGITRVFRTCNLNLSLGHRVGQPATARLRCVLQPMLPSLTGAPGLAAPSDSSAAAERASSCTANTGGSLRIAAESRSECSARLIRSADESRPRIYDVRRQKIEACK